MVESEFDGFASFAYIMEVTVMASNDVDNVGCV